MLFNLVESYCDDNGASLSAPFYQLPSPEVFSYKKYFLMPFSKIWLQKELPDYYLCISSPIDFKKIEENLKSFETGLKLNSMFFLTKNIFYSNWFNFIKIICFFSLGSNLSKIVLSEPHQKSAGRKRKKKHSSQKGLKLMRFF